jgi:Glycosyl transferase family 21
VAHRSLAVQIVLYDNDPRALTRQARRVAAAVRHASANNAVGEVAIRYGDCGERASLGASDTAEIEAIYGDAGATSFTVFGDNLGSAGGSNALAAQGSEEAIFVLNPDAYPAATSIAVLLDRLSDDVGAADARQLPLEHPKHFDARTGDTSWVSGACTMTQRRAFDSIGGYDADHFPMYCDDVDLSWRMRAAGWRAVHAPEAVVVHDKRLGTDGWPVASDFERRNWTVASLLLYHRYDRPDLIEAMLARLRRGEATEWEQAALAEYDDRLDAGNVPTPYSDTTVATFVDGFDAPHRFRWDAALDDNGSSLT